MRPKRFSWVAALFCLVTAGPAWSCRQALVLALDVSGSVDGVEYQEQVTGLAFALGHPEIRQIILADVANPVTLSVFEWSSQNHQYVILPWTRLDSTTALDVAIARIEQHRKVRAGLKTALGTALAFAHSMLTQQPACWDHTIDVSADGYNNVGPTPQQIYSSGLGRATVNALVVGKPDENSVEGPGIASDDLLKYFESEVIRGPGAFALYAQGYADYAQAMKKKLEKELKPPVIGLVAPSKATDRFEDS